MLIGGNLRNQGELITLLDANGNTVLSFTCSDLPPWPTSPDTEGTSLVLIDPIGEDPSLGSSWNASSEPGGSPGGPEISGAFADWLAARGESDPLATKPGDPVNNLLAYAFGLDLAGGDIAIALPRSGKITILDETFLTLEYRRRLSDPDVAYSVQSSRDGATWQNAAADIVAVSTTLEGDGTDRVTVRLNAPLGTEDIIFLRVLVTAP